jgi:glyoxylase-like metal-dependent hydrolase (beta-lactamase superfamily II)
MAAHPPFLSAGNAGPFTLDGTRTYRIGHHDVVLLDPGPDVDRHVRALVSWVADARDVKVLLTHGHKDHAASAHALSHALQAPVLGPPGIPEVDVVLEDGRSVETDEGPLVAVSTPGHTRHHYCYHWPARSALFAGDLLLGRGDTTWVAEYPGCVDDYLASLERLRALAPRVVYPAHGPPLTDVPAALDRYEGHRRKRIRQVEEVLVEDPEATVDRLLARVYGEALPQSMEGAARRSLEALLDHVRGAPGDR